MLALSETTRCSSSRRRRKGCERDEKFDWLTGDSIKIKLFPIRTLALCVCLCVCGRELSSVLSVLYQLVKLLASYNQCYFSSAAAAAAAASSPSFAACAVS